MRVDGGIDTHQLEHSANCGRGRGAVEAVPDMSRQPKDPPKKHAATSLFGMVHDVYRYRTCFIEMDVTEIGHPTKCIGGWILHMSLRMVD